MVIPIEERFMRYVEKTEGCWNWTGQTAGSKTRYGYFRVGTKQTDRRHPAHRVAHELWIGPIPEGFEVHHECGNILCVRPEHLRAVTPAENMFVERLTVCRAGLHDLTNPANVRWDSMGRRRGCYRCWLDRAKDRYHVQKEG